MNVGFYSYLIAFFSYSVLAVMLMFSAKRKQLGRPVFLAITMTSLWAAISALSAHLSFIPAAFIPISELARDASWCMLLLTIITPENNPSEERQAIGLRHFKTWWSIAVLFTVSIAFIMLFAGPLLTQYFDLASHRVNDFILISWVSLSIICLLLVEQIFRNTSPDQRWTIKYLCLAVGGIFAYDFFMYADALLFKQLNPSLWSARGIINALAVPLIAISIARVPQWSLGIHVSREVVFHSVTLMGAGIYLLAMAGAGYYIRYYGGDWGRVLQITFLCAAGLLLIALLFSDKIRAQVRVLLSKHFFSYKYDYREEWLKFTKNLAASGQDIPERVCQALATLVSSPGAMLWVRNERSAYKLLKRWNMPAPATISDLSLSSLSRFFRSSQWVIDLNEFRLEPGIYQDLEIPDWLTDIENAWLVIPLLLNDDVLGFVVVKRSEIHRNINWEDRDLLKMAGQQAAIYLSQHQAEQALIEARQFEAFNRLAAYIVHDLKNILAQQSLIVANAEKHKHNPDFIDDVIHTIENSVSRMTRLMEQMRSGLRGAEPTEIDLGELLVTVTQRYSAQLPRPTLEPLKTSLLVKADREQLSTVFGHIIQNAQEATDKNGHIAIRLSHDQYQAIIEIEDNGKGMDNTFIRDRLFKPFDTTKGLTGMGIGVFESRGVMQALGGDLRVESTPGKGTLFKLTLPCHAYNPEQTQNLVSEE